jgi:integrase
MPKQRRRDGIYWRKDCRKYWLSYVNESGVRQREPASVSHGEAMEMLRQRLEAVKERRNRTPGEVAVTDESFAATGQRYLDYQRPRLKPASFERERGIVEDYLMPSFAGRLRDITSAQISDYVTKRLGTMSKSSVKRELNLLKHIFRLAFDEWELLPESHPDPTRKVKAPKFKDERTQHLTPEEFRRVLLAAPEKYQPIFALLTATGMRRSELLECRWKYVHPTRILLPTSKNDEPKEVHLNVFAQKVLASIPQGGPDDRLFPDVTPEATTMAFCEVRKRLGLSDIRLHDLRHTCATWMRQQGTQLDVIASQLGHRDLRMTRRYARVAAVQVKQAVGGLDALLEPVLEAESGCVSHVGVTLVPQPVEEKPTSVLKSMPSGQHTDSPFRIANA